MASAGRRADPLAPLAPLVAAVGSSPLRPVLLLTGDDEWVLAESARRISASFRAKFPEGEVTEYEGNAGTAEAIADAATIALFATHRLVVLDATELFRARKLSAEEVDGLLDDALEAGLEAAPEAPREAALLARLSRRARALLALPRADDETLEERARRALGRVKRGERAGEMAALLSLTEDEEEAGESGADRLAAFVARATAGDNALLVRALSPDADHPLLRTLRRTAVSADLSAGDDTARRDRLAALGLERALERGVVVEGEVFDLLSERGRSGARAFLIELDRLIDTAPAKKVTAESAARLVADERKEYGSDFVEAFGARRPVEAVKILERLLASDGFTAFRPFGDRAEAPAKKGPRGEAAFFPILGLLAGEVRRMLALRACAEERGIPLRRTDYRGFVDRLLPALKAPRPGLSPLPIDGHPYALHRSFLAALEWPVADLADALEGIERIDRGVKSGAGTGPELLETFLLARV